jgi:sugar lactone lactonase YvrE
VTKAGRHIQVALDANATLGEGPIWAPGLGLLWVDIKAFLIHTFDPVLATDTAVNVGQRVSAVAQRRDGGLVAAVESGFATVDQATGACDVCAPVHGKTPLRMNDGRCDAAGRFWAGAMGPALEANVGGLYCWTWGGEAVLHVPGVTIPNGLDWSPDGKRMYFVESAANRIDVFDFDVAAGALGNRRVFAEIAAPAMPDGLTVDADGGVWVALWEGGSVVRYTPNGDVDVAIAVPTPRVTSCAFGGADLRDLFITSAQAIGPASHPGGAIFVCRPGHQGSNPNLFIAG